jgi:hypothetical protein
MTKTENTPKTWTRKTASAAQDRAMARGGWTRAEIRRGECPPLRLLVPPALWREVLAARIGGEPLYTPRAR